MRRKLQCPDSDMYYEAVMVKTMLLPGQEYTKTSMNRRVNLEGGKMAY